MKVKIIMFCLMISSYCFLAAKPLEIADVIAQYQSSNGEINGALLIAQNHNILFEKGFGYAKEGIKNTPKTQFSIGSVTKQFTASAVLKCFYDKVMKENPSLTEEEATKQVVGILNQPISFFLKSDNQIWSDDSPDWIDRVTIHHLLSHTSGIYNYTEGNEFENLTKLGSTDINEIVKIFAKKKLLFIPGMQYSYSNSGYFLLTKIIEQESGLLLGEYLDIHFFKPLNMLDTFLPQSGTLYQLADEYPLLAKGYCYDLLDEEKPAAVNINNTNMALLSGAGALISTVNDLNIWNQSLHGDKTLLPISILNLMLTRHSHIGNNIYYGYGIIIQDDCIWHNGLLEGYASELRYYPEQKTTVILLKNVSKSYKQQEFIQNEINSYLQKSYPLLFKTDYYNPTPHIEKFLKEQSNKS